MSAAPELFQQDRLVAAGAAFTTELWDAPTGIASKLTVTLNDTIPGSGLAVSVATTVTEGPAGYYQAQLTPPRGQPGHYVVIWLYSDPDNNINQDFQEPVVVRDTPVFSDLITWSLGDDFDRTKYETRVRQWLNDALALVARQTRTPDLESRVAYTTVAGLAQYNLPGDFVRDREVVFPDLARQAVRLDLQQFDALPDSLGTPSVYALSQNNLWLWPTPLAADVTLVLRYYRTALLQADTDLAPLPAPYHDLLVTYTRSRLFRAEDDIQQAQTYMQEYETGMARLAGDGSYQPGVTTQIPGMWPKRTVTPSFQ